MSGIDKIVPRGKKNDTQHAVDRFGMAEIQPGQMIHFYGQVSGIYIKLYALEPEFDGDHALVQHKHKLPHASFLLSGEGEFGSDSEEARIVTGPDLIDVPAHENHYFIPHGRCVFQCIHHVPEDEQPGVTLQNIDRVVEED